MSITAGERAEIDQRDALLDEIIGEVTDAVEAARTSGVEGFAYLGGIGLARRLMDLSRSEQSALLCHALARLAQARLIQARTEARS